MPLRMNPINLFRKSINVQFLTLSAIAIAFTGALVGLLSYQRAKNVIENKLSDKDLPALLKLKAVKIESELDKALKVSEIFSSDPELIEWFNSSEKNEKLEISTKSKMINIANQMDYTRIFASNVSTKNYYFFEKEQMRSEKIKIEAKKISESQKGDEWFFRFWNSGKTSEVNIDKSDERNTYAYINTIIKDKDKRIGVAGVGVRLTDFVDSFFPRIWITVKHG